MHNRSILHMDLDSFFVSVECLRNSSFLGKPLLIGGSSNRGVVASCSYEARKYGVKSAMPMRMALRLCPDAIVLKGDMDAYSKYSGLVTEIIKHDAPIYEKSSIDEFYLDLSGMDKYIGCYSWAKELRNKITKETGLPISFGLSINKLVSKVGTGEAKPNGTIRIPGGAERDFLAPLSTSKIPSIGKVAYKRLSFMGVRTVKTLREIPARLLEREFGKMGSDLWRKANAIDDAPVVPFDEQKSMSTERTFSVDTTDVNKLKDILVNMVTNLTFDLRKSGKLTSCITIKIRYSDFNTYTMQKRISYTAQDKELIKYAHELFDKLNQRRQLIRLIGVRYTGLVRGCYQVNLFDDTTEEINLLNQLDHIRNRFGSKLISRACLV